MVAICKRGNDGKLRLALQCTQGFPARQLAMDALGAENVYHLPVESLDTANPGEDAVIALIQHSAVGKRVLGTLPLRLGALPPSGYHIGSQAHRGGRVLVVVGGDLFGMLAGLADLLLHSERTARALLYRGGTRTEKPAFPLRYYWTWDHSTNWVLDDAGNQFSGCNNQYLKKPATFLEDYRRLIDHCVAMRFNGIAIWGFLRSAHGGEDYAYKVARYAADRGVAILPGLGTTGYGGIYYEGRHPYNLETYLAGNPRRGNMNKEGQYSVHEITPHHPANQAWIREGVEWLYRNFPIGGANMENSDYMVDYAPAGRRGRARIRSGEADYFKDQFFAYKTALETAHALAPEKWNLYATYSGFDTAAATHTQPTADMGPAPYFAKHLPPSAIAQWTLSGMLSETPIPLRAWMDHARPAAAYRNPRWPRGARPHTARSTGFCHQASQWSSTRRTDVALSTFAEACLRGHEAGLEGISVHGEVTNRSLAWKLNYLTMRHWTYHPQSTLEEFTLAELAPRLGGEKNARTFVEILCLLDENKAGPEVQTQLAGVSQMVGPVYQALSDPDDQPPLSNLTMSRMWEELAEWNTLKSGRKSVAHGGALA